MLFGNRCTACNAPGPPLCGPCLDTLTPADDLPPPEAVDGAVALVRYAGPGRALVVNLKYRNARGALRLLGRSLAALVCSRLTIGPEIPDDLVVTWAPTSAKRRRRRGYDQAHLLARAVAAGLGRPCRPLLHRGPGGPQTGRTAGERSAGPAFVAPAAVQGPVLVVDDVRTTGATLSSAAAALRAAGAPAVWAATIAVTPRRHPSAPSAPRAQRVSSAGRCPT